MEILHDPEMMLVLLLRVLGPLMIFRWPLLGILLSQYVFEMFDVVIGDLAGALQHIDIPFRHFEGKVRIQRSQFLILAGGLTV